MRLSTVTLSVQAFMQHEAVSVNTPRSSCSEKSQLVSAYVPTSAPALQPHLYFLSTGMIISGEPGLLAMTAGMSYEQKNSKPLSLGEGNPVGCISDDE